MFRKIKAVPNRLDLGNSEPQLLDKSYGFFRIGPDSLSFIVNCMPTIHTVIVYQTSNYRPWVSF